MISNLVFLAFLCSGSVFAAAWAKRTFEEVLPITAMSMVLLVFLFGILGQLYAGVVVCAVIAAALWLLAMAHVIWKKDGKETAAALLTPGAVVFLAMFFCLSMWNFNKVASEWDEFSHWVDIVKAMTAIDDFGTNPEANTMFQSYPPAMSIFQYILQKIYLALKPGGVFIEWRVYFAYQVFCFIPLFPLFKNCSYRKPFDILMYCVMVFLTPLIFYNNFYSSTYIDAFLGLLSGAGFAMVLLWDKKDKIYSANIWLMCAVLTLSKDVGRMFSAFLAAAYSVDMVFDSDLAATTSRKKNIVNIIISVSAVFIPKLLWKLELAISNAQISFSNKVDFRQLLLVLLGKDSSYRGSVLKTYCNGLIGKSVTAGHASITIIVSYAFLAVLYLCCFYLLYRLYREKLSKRKKAIKYVLIIAAAQELIYLFGMGVMYMFKFSEYEALKLASMERYLNMMFLSGWLLIMSMSIFAVTKLITSRIYKIVLLSFMLIVTPFKGFVNMVNGSDTMYSQYIRSKYEPIKEWAEDNCDGNQKIWIVSQDDAGFDKLVARFNLRPNSTNPGFTWCIGFSEAYDGMYAYERTPEQWREELMEDYDYVVIYDLNDYFTEHYANLFEGTGEIVENSLYSVDREAGLLVRDHGLDNYIK